MRVSGRAAARVRFAKKDDKTQNKSSKERAREVFDGEVKELLSSGRRLGILGQTGDSG